MTLEEITGGLEDLSGEELRLLRHDISAEIDRRWEQIPTKTARLQHRVEDLCNVMSSIIKEDVTRRTRKRPVPFCRAIIAKTLREDGFTTTEIGRALHLNHTTILWGCKNIDAVLTYPAMFPEEHDIWLRFKMEVR